MWASRYWSKINKGTITLMALLGAVATLLALLQTVSIFIIAGLAALFTFMICLYAVIQPAEKKHKHLRSAKDFQNLMMRMVRCQTGIEFEQLWHEINRCVFEEPLLKKRHIFPIAKDTENVQWNMTQDLSKYIEKKKEEAKKMVKQYANRCVGTTSDVVNIEPWQFNNHQQRSGFGGNGNVLYNSYNTYPGSSTTGTLTYNQANDYRFTNGFNHQKAIVTTTSHPDDEFEVLIAQKSHQEVWEGGKRKKRQIFEQFRRSKSMK